MKVIVLENQQWKSLMNSLRKSPIVQTVLERNLIESRIQELAEDENTATPAELIDFINQAIIDDYMTKRHKQWDEGMVRIVNGLKAITEILEED